MTAHRNSASSKPRAGHCRNHEWRVWFIVALGGLLIAQGAVDGLARSMGNTPYPTIAMPGFGATQVGTDGRARVTDMRIQIIDASGSMYSVAPHILLSPMPNASAAATLSRIFGPSAAEAPELSPEAVDYLRRQVERLNLDSDPVGLRLEWQPEILDIRNLQRAAVGKAIVREVNW